MFRCAVLLFCLVGCASGISQSCQIDPHTQPCYDPKVLRCRNHGRFANTSACIGLHGGTPAENLPKCFNMSGADPFNAKNRFWNVFVCPSGDCTRRYRDGTVSENQFKYGLWVDGAWSIAAADTNNDGTVFINFGNIPGYPVNSTRYYIAVLSTSNQAGWSVKEHEISVDFCENQIAEHRRMGLF